jgi:LPS export ABC transporter protein LptC
MKNTSNKAFIILIVFSITTIALFFVFNFSGYSVEKKRFELLKSRKQNTDSVSVDNAEIIIKDLILKEIEKHKGLQVVINACEGKIIHSEDKIECTNIKCFLSSQEKEIANLVANTAIIDKASKNIFLSGDTVVRFNDITMIGQDVFYNYSSQVLSTKEQTKYCHPNFFVLAQQSTIDIKKNIICMGGGVKSEILNHPASNCGSD